MLSPLMYLDGFGEFVLQMFLMGILNDVQFNFFMNKYIDNFRIYRNMYNKLQ
jgi:hypothetical protein